MSPKQELLRSLWVRFTPGVLEVALRPELDADGSSVLLHDLPADGQAQAHALRALRLTHRPLSTQRAQYPLIQEYALNLNIEVPIN